MTQDANPKEFLWAAVVDLDLQIYKASIYKKRWLTPGGLDHALPALEQARLTVEQMVDWPAEIAGQVDDFKKVLSDYTATLEARDHTTASAQQTALFQALERVREAVRGL